MPCPNPSCKGTTRRQIAPAYFECTSEVLITAQGPGSVDPSSGPPVLSRVGVCGRRFQEGLPAPTEVCDCGTFSVGVCCACERAVCGDCSELRQGQRRCSDCDRDARSTEAAGREAARQTLKEKLTEELAALENVQDLVRACSSAPTAVKQELHDYVVQRLLQNALELKTLALDVRKHLPSATAADSEGRMLNLLHQAATAYRYSTFRGEQISTATQWARYYIREDGALRRGHSQLESYSRWRKKPAPLITERLDVKPWVVELLLKRNDRTRGLAT